MVLYQYDKQYCYNSDSYFLLNFIDEVLLHYKNISGNLLDVGSGSGIIGLVLKKQYPKLNLFANEIQDNFIFLTKKNASINKVDINLIKGDFLDIKKNNFFDIIVSNPPFYPKETIPSPNISLSISRNSTSLPLENFLQQSSSLLKNKAN